MPECDSVPHNMKAGCPRRRLGLCFQQILSRCRRAGHRQGHCPQRTLRLARTGGRRSLRFRLGPCGQRAEVGTRDQRWPRCRHHNRLARAYDAAASARCRSLPGYIDSCGGTARMMRLHSTKCGARFHAPSKHRTVRFRSPVKPMGSSSGLDLPASAFSDVD